MKYTNTLRGIKGGVRGIAWIVTAILIGHPALSEDVRPGILVTLPAEYNTPDGLAAWKDGNVILSVPNFNNEYLVKKGTIHEPSPPVMAVIDRNNEISAWYSFQEKDLHPETGKIGPMDCAFGPDGNLYVADLQVLWNGNHKSRVLRINVEDDRPVSMDVVVEGLIAANGMVWKEDVLFVSDSILAHPPQVKEGEQKPTMESGVYAFSLKELQGSVVRLSPYSDTGADSRLVVTFRSGNTMGFGADGVAVDEEGNLYTSVVEDGAIYRTKLNENNVAVETRLYAKSEKMKSSDGIVFRAADRRIYVADLLQNAVHSVDPEGNVTTVYQNGDTDGADGSLDQPVELLLRGNDLIIVNMDIAWLTPPGMAVNTEVDVPYTLSVIRLQ